VLNKSEKISPQAILGLYDFSSRVFLFEYKSSRNLSVTQVQISNWSFHL